MNTGSDDNDREALNLPPWTDCDLFCIHEYAGTGTSPCGWRGRVRDARRDRVEAKVLCPRCGCDTLLRIPLNGSPLE